MRQTWLAAVLLSSVAAQNSSPLQVEARFVDPAGKPIAGVGVVAGAAGSLYTADALQRPLQVSKADGRIRFQVEPGARMGYTMVQKYAMFAKEGFTTLRVLINQNAYYNAFGKQGGSTKVALGQHVLYPATKVEGFVRGAKGRPVAGARVLAGAPNTLGSLARFIYVYGRSVGQNIGTARTDAKGRFVIHGVQPNGVGIELSAAGYYSKSFPCVDARRALDLTLEPSGFVTGRVVDADGKPVLASINPSYETSRQIYASNTSTLLTDADGKFKLTLTRRGRYTVRAVLVTKNGGRYQSAVSGILSGARANVSIELSPPPDADKPKLPVTVVDSVTGKPVETARVVVQWQDPRYLNEAVMENWFVNNARPTKDGKVELPAPIANQPPQGTLLVRAKGYAPKLVKGVEYDEEKPKPVKVEVVAGVELSGVALDEVTGKPLADAEVSVWRAGARAANPYNYSGVSNRASATVKTDADGRFVLRDLPSGRLELEAKTEGRPKSKTLRLKLATSERRKGLKLSVPKGVAFSGRIFMGKTKDGKKIAPQLTGGRWRVRLSANSATSYSPFSSFSIGPVGYSGVPNAGIEVDLDADGKFRFDGLGRGRYRFSLIAPPVGLRGGPLATIVEPLRIRSKDLQRDIDVSEDLSGIVRGKVRLPGVKIPMSRLSILSLPATSSTVLRQRRMFNLTWFRCAVEDDGSFAFRAAKGKHDLWIVDAVGGITVYRAPELLDVKAGGTTKWNPSVPLALVRLRLRPVDAKLGFFASTLDIGVTHPGEPENVNFYRTNQNMGLAIEGRREILLQLPPIKVQLAVRNSVMRIDPKGGHQYGAIGEFEGTPVLGTLNTFEIKVEPPPETAEPAEEADAKNQKRPAKAAAEVKKQS